MPRLRAILGSPAIALLAVVLAVSCRTAHERVWTTVPGTPPAKGRPYDLVWTAVDRNCSPQNPTWAGDHGPDGPEPPPLCATRPDVKACTTQRTVIDEPGRWGALLCGLSGSYHDGHVDWTLAATNGRAMWLDRAADLDYTLALFPDGDAGITWRNDAVVLAGADRPFLELEFNQTETVDHFGTRWWREFAAVVRKTVGPFGTPHTEEIAAVLNRSTPATPPRAVAYGLFGLDCEHECRSEIHPVLALAIEVNDAPHDDTWAVFVRNSGGQGLCSRYFHEMALPKDGLFRLTLPRHGKAPVVKAGTEFSGRAVTFPQIELAPAEGGTGEIVLTFKLPPDIAADADMELHVDWTGGVAAEPPAPAAARTGGGRRKRPGEPQWTRAESYLGKLLGNPKTTGPPDQEVSILPVPKGVTVERLGKPLDVGPYRGRCSGTPPARVARAWQHEPMTADRALLESACCAAAGSKWPPFNGRDISGLCRRLGPLDCRPAKTITPPAARKPSGRD